MQTEELVAGRELDALVAEKVMGLTNVGIHNSWCAAYSSDIGAAWEVLDAMVWRVGTANIRLDMEDYGRGFLNDEGAERAVWVTIGDWTVCGPAPLAICKAALAALNS